MKNEAVFITLLIFLIIGLIPIMVKGKNNKFGTVVNILTLISVIAVIPSIMLQLDLGQTFIIILWIIAMILSIIGRNKKQTN